MVIPTYTVIIQNEKTTHDFNKYIPLFSKALSDNEIGLCKWIESGTTLESALPGLPELTNDKEEWRAIVVRYTDDSAMLKYPCDKQNPYDFNAYSQAGIPLKESEVPLVRLTHILAGVPMPETEFEPAIICEEGKAPRTVYRPVENESEMATYRDLTEKYSFNGKKPTSVILLSVRENFRSNTIHDAWTSHTESGSSEFWKRNQYPDKTRFLVFDFDRQGPVKRIEDEFRFWTTLLLLSVNQIDASVLQAYRLYHADSVIDTQRLGSHFQNTVNHLRRARNKIEDEIKRGSSTRYMQNPEYPHFRLDIPVGVEMPKNDEREISKSSFGLLSDGISSDIGEWDMKKKALEKSLDECARSADRELDITAEKTRDVCSYEENEVYEITRYQREDLARESFELCDEIIETQGDLPTGNISSDENIVKADKDVRDHLKRRAAKGPVTLSLTASLVLILLCGIPELIKYFRGESEISLINIILSDLGIFAIIAIFGICALIFQKLSLNKSIKSYNHLIAAAFNRITENASNYSSYLSAIASDCRANSFLHITERIRLRQNNSHHSKFKLMKSIDLMLYKIKMWSKAFYLCPDFSMVLPDNKDVWDINIQMIEQSLYITANEKKAKVEVNSSGSYIDSPFDFVTELDIVREELYDD